MIRKAFLIKLFDAANMKRWNDKICPVELRELDKQAHKMIIAYVLGKFEENNEGFDWIKIIEGGIFEFLQRLVVTDLKPSIFHKIEADKDKYKKLNAWVYKEIQPYISCLGQDFCDKFKSYFFEKEDLNKKILCAAHYYATKWEFDIIERANPNGYEILEIKNELQKTLENFYNLEGISNLAKYSNIKQFVDLCGELRFQVRWSHLHRVPRTSVLGHMFIVAILSYLFSLEVEEIKVCKNRCINNYFTGLFHDLPEVLTRDIKAPLKKSVKGLEDLIKEYEDEEMKKIYKLIPKEWHSEIEMFTKNEFTNIKENNKIIRDGETIVKPADDLAAFIEAYLALENGIKSSELEKAKNSLKEEYGGKTISGINFGEIYADF